MIFLIEKKERGHIRPTKENTRKISTDRLGKYIQIIHYKDDVYNIFIDNKRHI